MIIRKQFKFEGAHIVRDCSSDRCKESIHGHSYIVEVFFTSNKLDNGMMIVDFGLLKGTIGDFLDSFDHSYSFWRKESDEFKSFIKNNCARWVEMPISPSAEGYALMFLSIIRRIVDLTCFNNGEGDVEVSSVRVHETATGYAEAFQEDLADFEEIHATQILFSDQVKKEWKDPEMWNKIMYGDYFQNPKVNLKYSDK
jgi:6-pyruvoyltetrahydropterin/6-carboxytetrahydropterin synthase